MHVRMLYLYPIRFANADIPIHTARVVLIGIVDRWNTTSPRRFPLRPPYLYERIFKVSRTLKGTYYMIQGPVVS